MIHSISSVWYTDRIPRELGISKWDPKHLYIAYHEGIGGYRRGRWRNDDHLLRAAATVDHRAREYGAQLKRCKQRDAADLRGRSVGMIVCASFAGATRCHRSCLTWHRGVYCFEWVCLSQHSRLPAGWPTIADGIDLSAA